MADMQSPQHPLEVLPAMLNLVVKQAQLLCHFGVLTFIASANGQDTSRSRVPQSKASWSFQETYHGDRHISQSAIS